MCVCVCVERPSAEHHILIIICILLCCCCTQIIYLNRTAEEAYAPLTCGDIPPYVRFCDASYGPSPYKVTLLDCLQAVYKAHRLGFFAFDDFDANEYEYYEVRIVL